ncbi:MAG: peptidase, partial [Chitinophagaceae bacterium]
MRLLFSVSFCLLFIAAAAQNLLPTPRNIQATYDKGTRSVDGKPGKSYWQNTADYDLSVSYAPDTRLLSGTVDINYTNNSPDPLRSTLFKLYPNYYKKGAPRESAVSPDDLTDGVVIEEISAGGKTIDVSKLRIDNTNMMVGNPEPLATGKSIHFTIKYHYTLNKGSHMRTGEIEPNAAFIAYFFPRVAVYDDIDGWNTYPYNGSQEFYNDFCHFKATIKVPQNFIVWATGDLKNGQDIITPKYYQRLQQAEQSDEVTTIIDTTDLPNKDFTGTSPFYSWQFEAGNVTDFVFALSDHYIWKSSSLVVDPQTKRRTR